MTRKPKIEILIGLLAVISIISLIIESLVNLSTEWLVSIYAVDFAICVVFALDFIYRLKSTENKSHFLKFHGYEILAIIPAVALSALGTIPAISAGLRSLRLIRIVRLFLVMARMRRFFTTSGRFIQRTRLVALLGITMSIVFISAFVVFLLESGTASAQITNFSDAVWWSISTVTTVGYGDIVPNSIGGRVMGMVLMIVGIGVMAAFISQVSATLVESRIKQPSEIGNLKATIVSEIKDSIDRVDELTDNEVSLLIHMIQSLRRTSE